MSPSPRHGFTLVEMSIVLVIVGLLVGGILSGQALIRASELRSVITQYNGFITAIDSFKEKYTAVPGDMPEAQTYWGVAHATPGTCVTTVGTGTQTCNGDGDKRISPWSAGANESYRFWQHLANAGLISGNFSGVTGPGGATTSILTNSPVGKISNSVWFTYNWGTLSNDTWVFDGVYNNSFAFGGIQTNSWPATPIFKPEEMFNLDTKMDDGKPATGKMLTTAFGSCTNATLSSNLAATYTVNNTATGCGIIFPQAY